MPFTEEQAPFFFGRDHEREIIAANLIAARLTLLYGPSGVGKSSVLNAGVVHSLRALGRDATVSGGHPQFAIVLFKNWRDQPLADLERTIERESGAAGQGAAFADRLQFRAQQIDGDILIILDQFEEYFMYHPNEEGEGTFAAEFARAVNRRDLRVNFLLSMREDSIAKLDFFKGRIPNLFDNYLRIDRLDREQAREAIVRPIEQFNRLTPDRTAHFAIEPVLVDDVLDQVKATPTAREDAGKGGIRESADLGIETPHLQLVMTRLWQEEMNAGSVVLRVDTLRRLGGASEIVKRHVDSALDALTPAERDAAAHIFQYLVTPAGTKIALGVDDLYPNAGMSAPDLGALLVKLSSGENRILTSVAPAPDQPARERYQIFHDVLAGKVLDWRSRYVKAVEQRAAQAMAEEERRKAEKEAQAATRLRRLLAAVAVLFIVASGFAWFGWQQSRAAERSRLKADQAAAEAESANHSAEARRLEVLAANASKAALEATNESLRLEKQAADARLAGRDEQARRLGQQAAAATQLAASSERDAVRFADEQLKEQKAADLALTQAAQMGGRADPVVPAAAPRPAVETPPAPTATGPTAVPSLPVTTPAAVPRVPSTAVPPTGDYREVYRKAIDAKNRKRWDEAAGLFQASLALRGTDTGERINISGFGNIEPYVPHYYLGLAFMNQNNCQQALSNWDLSEKDGAIQKTSLYASLQENRKRCLRGQ